MSFSKKTENTITSKSEFLSVLSRVRQDGFATDLGEDMEGVNCVGAPIFNEYGEPIAALWISAPSGRINAHNISSYGNLLLRYSDEITNKLG